MLSKYSTVSWCRLLLLLSHVTRAQTRNMLCKQASSSWVRLPLLGHWRSNADSGSFSMIFFRSVFINWLVDYILMLYQHYSSLRHAVLLKITESWSSGGGVGCNSRSTLTFHPRSVLWLVTKNPSLPLAASRVCCLVIVGTRRPVTALWKHGLGLEV